MKRTPIIAGNWKMFKTVQEAVGTAKQLADIVSDVSEKDVMIAPPFTALAAVGAALQDATIAVGAQNLHWESQGAFTGEIAPAMVKAAGCRYAIIGHSERRQLFGETDESVNRKVHAVAEAGLGTILCIGETLEERESDSTLDVLRRQVRFALRNLSTEQMAHAIVSGISR